MTDQQPGAKPFDRETLQQLLPLVDAVFQEMIMHQRLKVRELGRAIQPGVTDEDIRNAQDFPALMADSSFNYEDGTLAGLIAAHVAIKRRLLHPLADGEHPEPILEPTDVELRFYERLLREREGKAVRKVGDGAARRDGGKPRRPQIPTQG